MVPNRYDGFFKPFPVISQNRLGYFFWALKEEIMNNAGTKYKSRKWFI